MFATNVLYFNGLSMQSVATYGNDFIRNGPCKNIILRFDNDNKNTVRITRSESSDNCAISDDNSIAAIVETNTAIKKYLDIVLKSYDKSIIDEKSEFLGIINGYKAFMENIFAKAVSFDDFSADNFSLYADIQEARSMIIDLFFDIKEGKYRKQAGTTDIDTLLSDLDYIISEHTRILQKVNQETIGKFLK